MVLTISVFIWLLSNPGTEIVHGLVRVEHAGASNDSEEVVRPLEQTDMHSDNSGGCFFKVNVYCHINCLLPASP